MIGGKPAGKFLHPVELWSAAVARAYGRAHYTMEDTRRAAVERPAASAEAQAGGAGEKVQYLFTFRRHPRPVRLGEYIRYKGLFYKAVSLTADPFSEEITVVGDLCSPQPDVESSARR